MEELLSITKDTGEYYIILKDNSNLIANVYEKICQKWPLKPQNNLVSCTYKWKVLTKYGQSWLKDSIQNKCYEKKVWKSKA
jgi:hypothetical protein